MLCETKYKINWNLGQDMVSIRKNIYTEST